MTNTSLRALFQEILKEEQFEKLPPYVARPVAIPEVAGKALAFIGVRRSGKTTLLRQLYDVAKDSGLRPSEDLLVVNFFDERLSDLTGKELSTLLEAHAELYPNRSSERPLHLFLDEIQLVEKWELFVSRMVRTPNTKVFLSGSSAKMLSKEIASSMRGRALAVEIFPFSFQEYLSFHNITNEMNLPQARARLRDAIKTYLREGGFPETFQKSATTQRLILQEYHDVMLLRDIIERHQPSAPLVVKAVLRLLFNQTGSLFTINKLYEKLRSQGFSLQKAQLSESLSWFEDAFCLFPVPIYTTSEQVRQVNPRKIYCVDTGLACAMSFSIAQNRGALLENLVFMHLRRNFRDVSYVRTSNGFEIDFVVHDDKNVVRLIQVTESLSNEETRKREVRAITEAMQEFKVKESLIVTLDDDETEIAAVNSRIKVTPVWRFLLDDAWLSTE